MTKEKSKFLRVKCENVRDEKTGQTCNNEQTIFSRASVSVKCLVCGQVLAEPGGGEVKLLKARVLEALK